MRDPGADAGRIARQGANERDNLVVVPAAAREAIVFEFRAPDAAKA